MTRAAEVGTGNRARPAVHADVARLVELYQSCAHELAPLRGGRVLLGLHGRGQGLAQGNLAQGNLSDGPWDQDNDKNQDQDQDQAMLAAFVQELASPDHLVVVGCNVLPAHTNEKPRPPVSNPDGAHVPTTGRASVDVDRGTQKVDGGTQKVVGYGVARTVPLGHGELLAEVTDLFVLPAYRRQGTGRAMAEVLVAWAVEAGCVGIDAWALPGSRAVKSFFEARRFTARALVMHQALGPRR